MPGWGTKIPHVVLHSVNKWIHKNICLVWKTHRETDSVSWVVFSSRLYLSAVAPSSLFLSSWPLPFHLHSLPQHSFHLSITWQKPLSLAFLFVWHILPSYRGRIWLFLSQPYGHPSASSGKGFQEPLGYQSPQILKSFTYKGAVRWRVCSLNPWSSVPQIRPARVRISH